MTIPLIGIFNAANSALRRAKYAADRQMYGHADRELAVAGGFVRLLQTYAPSPEPDLKGGQLRVSRDSLDGITIMFHFQVQRWNIDPDSIDDGLFALTEV